LTEEKGDNVKLNRAANERNGLVADKARRTKRKKRRALGTSVEESIIKSAQCKRKAIHKLFSQEAARRLTDGQVVEYPDGELHIN